jgi:hypothetical protein
MNAHMKGKMNEALRGNRGCATVVSWLMMAAGVFFFGALITHDVRLALTGQFADGVVTKVIERTTSSRSSSSNGKRQRSAPGVSYTLVVRYRPQDMEPVEFKTSSTFGHSHKEDDAVKVIYLRSNPTMAEIYSAKQLWLPICVGFVVSTVCLYGGRLLRRAVKAAHAPPPT